MIFKELETLSSLLVVSFGGFRQSSILGFYIAGFGSFCGKVLLFKVCKRGILHFRIHFSFFIFCDPNFSSLVTPVYVVAYVASQCLFVVYFMAQNGWFGGDLY